MRERERDWQRKILSLTSVLIDGNALVKKQAMDAFAHRLTSAESISGGLCKVMR